jgi:hypothetical protein
VLVVLKDPVSDFEAVDESVSDNINDVVCDREQEKDDSVFVVEDV